MKFKSHKLLRFLIFPEFLILCTICVFFGIVILNDPAVKEKLLYRVFTIVLMFGGPMLIAFLMLKVENLWTRVFATVFVTSTEVCWSCPLLRSKTLPLPQCTITVETETNRWGLQFPYICFSIAPHTKIERVGYMRCSEDFIKFWYSEALCSYLIGNLPKEQTTRLEYYRYIEQKESKK